LTIYLSICIFWLTLCVNVHAQVLEKDYGEINLSEIGITITPEDFKKARIKGEEVKTIVAKSIDEISSSIANVKRDIKAMGAYLERFHQERMDYLGKEVSSGFLELLDEEIAIVREKIDIDKELIEKHMRIGLKYFMISQKLMMK
jgi:uncharacterized protein YicC (UPF0701 family)